MTSFCAKKAAEFKKSYHKYSDFKKKIKDNSSFLNYYLYICSVKV